MATDRPSSSHTTWKCSEHEPTCIVCVCTMRRGTTAHATALPFPFVRASGFWGGMCIYALCERSRYPRSEIENRRYPRSEIESRSGSAWATMHGRHAWAIYMAIHFQYLKATSLSPPSPISLSLPSETYPRRANQHDEHSAQARVRGFRAMHRDCACTRERMPLQLPTLFRSSRGKHCGHREQFELAMVGQLKQRTASLEIPRDSSRKSETCGARRAESDGRH